MPAGYSVMTSFNARDRVSPAFDAMGRSADRMAGRTSTAFRNATKDGYKFMTIVKGILAANAIRGGIGQIGSGAQKIATDFLKFDDVLIGAVARFDDLGPSVVKNTAFMSKFGKEVRKSIEGTRFAAVDAVGALNELAKAGYESRTGLGILRNMMDFATAGQEDLVVATTMSSDLLGSFGMRDKDVQKQLKNHIMLNDMLTKSALLSTGGLADLNESLKSTAPLTKELNMTATQVLAITTALTNAGIKGDIAATAIKRAMINIYSGKNDEWFAANKILTSDPKTGKLREFSSIMGDIAKRLDMARPDVKAKALFDIFGAYGFAGNVKILRQLEMIADYEKKIDPATSRGSSKLVADAQNMSTYAKLMMLANTLVERGFQVLESFSAKGQKGIDGLIKTIKAGDVKPLIRDLHAIADALKSIMGAIKPFLPYVAPLIKLWVTFRVGLASIKMLKFGKDMLFVFNTLRGGLGFMGALNTVLGTISGYVGLIGANFMIWSEAYKSLTTGKDNWISELAQKIGLVPKLIKDADGNIIGRDPGYTDKPSSMLPSGNGSSWYAPNAKEAEARRINFQGQLNIAGAPPGSTYTSKTSGAPAIQTLLMGANP